MLRLDRQLHVIAIQTKHQKHRPNIWDNAYWQDHARAYTLVKLIAISIVTMQSIWHELHAQFPAQIFHSCGATYRRNYETCRKQRPNRSINVEAILPQSATKLTKTYGSEFGSLLWRHLTPQRKTAI